MTPISSAEHKCQFPWCTGTIWPDRHWDSHLTPTTGTDHNVRDGVEVLVVTTFDEDEDARPKILLHIGDNDSRDTDCCPTPAEARRIAVNLLAAADAIEGQPDIRGRARA